MSRRILDDHILRETGPDAERLTLWLPGQVDGNLRYWQRISEVPQTKFTVMPGFCAVAATALEARQRIGGFLSRMLAPLTGRPHSTGTAWNLPNGEVAEQFGSRRNDLLLVWTEDAHVRIDEAWVKSQWPQGSRVQRLGESLYLVSGVQPPGAMAESEQSAGARHSAAAENVLMAAHDSGDRRRVAAALADLGVAYLIEQRADLANRSLQEALRLANELGDKSVQIEALCSLSWSALAGDPGRALETSSQALLLARETANRYGEKIALQRMGSAYVRTGAPTRAIDAFQQALVLARQLNDHKHEAELLWYLAIEYADLGQREQVRHHSEAAIELMEQARNPKAAWFRRHFEKYWAGETGGTLGSGDDAGSAAFEMSAGELPTAEFLASPDAGAAQGPGLLRMALSATKAMARFVGSGFKTTPGATAQYRLRTCAACPHHTGLRCRLCGCFTSAKARIAHEMCPIGKWPPID